MRRLNQLGSGRTLFLASDDTLHSVPSDVLWMACEIDPNLVVLRRNPDPLTDNDRRMLSAMGITWDEELSLEALMCVILDAAISRNNAT